MASRAHLWRAEAENKDPNVLKNKKHKQAGTGEQRERTVALWVLIWEKKLWIENTSTSVATEESFQLSIQVKILVITERREKLER